MQYKDTGLGFGVVTLVFHWLGAVLMVAFIITCVTAALTDNPPGSDRYALALSIGYLCAPLYLFRIYWRFKHPYPMPLGTASPAQVLIGRAVGFGMLLAGVLLPVLLWGVDSSVGTTNIILATLFWLGVTAFSLGFLLHLYGAFSHHILQKDETLLRLLGKKIEL